MNTSEDLERARRRIEALGPPWQLQEPERGDRDRSYYIHEPDDWDDKCGPHSIRCRTIEIVHNELDEIEKVASSIVSGVAEVKLIKFDLLEVLRHELGGWDIDPTLLRKAFMAAVAELVDDDFGGEQAA